MSAAMPRCERAASHAGSYGKSSHGILLRATAGFNPLSLIDDDHLAAKRTPPLAYRQECIRPS
jgi:hypothetical protein